MLNTINQIAKASRKIVSEAEAQGITSEDAVEAIVKELICDPKTLNEITISTQFRAYKHAHDKYRGPYVERLCLENTFRFFKYPYIGYLGLAVNTGAYFGPLRCLVLYGTVAYPDVKSAVKQGLIDALGLNLCDAAVAFFNSRVEYYKNHIRKLFSSRIEGYMANCKLNTINQIAKASRKIVAEAGAQNITNEDDVESIVIGLFFANATFHEIMHDAMIVAGEHLYNTYRHSFDASRAVRNRFVNDLSLIAKSGADFGPLSCLAANGKAAYPDVTAAVKQGLIDALGLAIFETARNAANTDVFVK